MTMFYKKRISESNKEVVIKEINKSDNIINWSVSELIEIENNPNHIVRYLFSSRQNLLGLYVIKKINEEYKELTLGLIFEEYRHRGYGKRIINDCLNEVGMEDSVYAASRNPSIKKLLKKKEFRNRSLLRLPIGILFYLLKTKFKIYKIPSILSKGRLSGWGYFIRKSAVKSSNSDIIQ